MKRKDEQQNISVGASPGSKPILGESGLEEPVFNLDDDEVLASVLFDNEVDRKMLNPVNGELSDATRRDLKDYSRIRSGVQDWFQSIAAETAQKSPTDLWSKIEAAITAEAGRTILEPARYQQTIQQQPAQLAAGRFAPAEFIKSADRFFGRLFGFEASSGSGQNWSWRDVIAYGSSVGAIAVLVLLFFNSSFFGGSSGGFSSPAAGNGAIGPNLAFQPPGQDLHTQPEDLNSRSVILNARNSDGLNGSDQLAVRDVSVQSGGGRVQPFGGLSSRDIQIDRLLQHSRLASVLRTDGADIEWIRSDRDFNLMPSANGKAPPAIWIARSTTPR